MTQPPLNHHFRSKDESWQAVVDSLSDLLNRTMDVRSDPWRLGRIAVNGRTNAVRNPLAAMRTPITLDDYFAARMAREPLCLLDMELPVDAADAVVLSSAERAGGMPHAPVLVHAMS